MVFEDRKDAARQLAEALKNRRRKDTVVLSLPRGGTVLGAEVARRFNIPLGVVLVRKIGHPEHPEYAIGAVVEDEEAVYDQTEVSVIDEEWLKKAESQARNLIERRQTMYYDDDVVPPEIRGRPVLLVDDGIATGLSMKAVLIALRNRHALRITIAVPVASPDSKKMLEKLADEVLILDDPERFKGSVGAHYRHFDEIDDEETRRLLKEASYELHQTAA